MAHPAQHKRHMCVKECPTHRQEPTRHVCTGMCPATRQVAQAPRVRMGVPSAPPAWRLGPAGYSLHTCPPPTVQSTVKTLTVYSIRATV
jgi:hypothetical protein